MLTSGSLRMTPLAPEHLFTTGVVVCGGIHGLEPPFRPFLWRAKEVIFYYDCTQSEIV